MRRVDSLEKTNAGRTWRQGEKGTTEDEMGGWHHQLDGREFEWTPGAVDGQGGLACCYSWGRKESDTTEWLNWVQWLEALLSQHSQLYFPVMSFSFSVFPALPPLIHVAALPSPENFFVYWSFCRWCLCFMYFCLSNCSCKSAKIVGVVQHLNLEIQTQPILPAPAMGSLVGL